MKKTPWYVLVMMIFLSSSLLVISNPALAADNDPAAGSVTAVKTPFSDVPATDANAIYVNFLSQRGIISGYPDGRFYPNEGLSRAQAAIVIVKAAGLTLDPNSKSPFDDVSQNHWARAYIAAATQAGYTKGMGDGSYHPEDTLSRAQAISLILKLSSKDISGVKLPASLTDIDSQHWAAQSVAVGLASGMVGLSADGKQYLPNAPFSRINLAHALGVLLTGDPGLYATTLEGQLKIREGLVSVQTGGNQEQKQIKTPTTVKAGDIITTGANSSAELNYPDGSSMLIKENTQITVVSSKGRKYIRTDGSEGTAVDWLDLKLKQGTILGGLATRHESTGTEQPGTNQKTGQIIKQIGSKLIASLQSIGLIAEDQSSEELPWYAASEEKKVKIQVDMPWGVAAVRGTFVAITVDPSGQSTVSCLTGNADVSNHGVTVALTGNQSTQVTQASAPPPPPVVLPPAAVQQFVQEQTWLQQTAQIMQQVQEAAPPPPPVAVDIIITAPPVEQVTPVTPVAPVTPVVPLSITQIINQAMQTVTANPAPATTATTTTTNGVGNTTGSNHAPTVSGVMISGTAQVGEILSGHYSYTDVENNPEGTSIYKWYTGSTDDGAGKTAITGASGTTYTLASSDTDKYIFFEVTPIAQSGKTTGTVVISMACGPVATGTKETPVANTAVAATAVNVGQTLADSILSGTFKNSVAAEVYGALTWDNTATVVNATGNFAWTFTPTDTATYNVVTGTVNVTANAVAPTAITAAGVTGFVAPVTGATPEAVGSLTPGSSEYTVTGLTWLPTDSPYAATMAYTATVTLTSATGYEFPAAGIPAPTANGVGTVSAGTTNGTGSGNTLTFTVQFPTTMAAQLTITAPTLTLTKAYEGTTTAAVTAGTLAGVVGSDVVTVSAAANYDTAAVGTGKTITVVYTLGGADAAKYIAPVNYTVATGVITAAQFSIDNDKNIVLPVDINQLPLTMEAWVKPELRTDTAPPSVSWSVYAPNNVISNDNPALFGFGFGVNIWNDNSEFVVEYHNGFRVVPNITFNSGNWYHIAIVYTQGNEKAYVNGALVDDYSYNQESLDGVNFVRIGKHNDDSNWGTRRYFNGSITNVRILDKDLSQEEILQNMNNMVNGQETNSIGYWIGE